MDAVESCGSMDAVESCGSSKLNPRELIGGFGLLAIACATKSIGLRYAQAPRRN
jgi:hypothetical protein